MHLRVFVVFVTIVVFVSNRLVSFPLHTHSAFILENDFPGEHGI
jgi:hypothetical protein